MTQQTSWRCAECDAVVTSLGEGRSSPKCPNCGTPKDPGAGETREVPSRSYDGRAGKRFAELAGPDLDRLLARRVLGGAGDATTPPYSSEDWAAMALADLVGRQSAWSFQLAFCGEAWMATFAEKGDPREAIPGPPLASFVSASGASRALAIARALLKVVRSPRWRPLGETFLTRGFALTPTTLANA